VNNYLFPFQGHPPSLDLPGLQKQALKFGESTLHANTPSDVPARLEALGMLGGLQ
jgi:pilus assembly protein CpaF